MKSVLGFPLIYRFFCNIVGANHLYAVYINHYCKVKEGDRILDIGCGIGYILEYLPDVEYVGFDMDNRYIDFAKKRYGDRGTFLCKKVTKEAIKENSYFDIIMALGILHHLNEKEGIELFKLADVALKPNGRLITVDLCYAQNQSLATKLILSKDRGKYIRKQDEYFSLASRVFKNIKIDVRDDLLRIPCTHCIIQCRK